MNTPNHKHNSKGDDMSNDRDETAEEMRAAGDDGWDDVTDVDAELRKMRDKIESKACDRIARMEALVKRLSEYNPPLLDSEQYEVYQIIQEAKELADRD